VEVSSAIAQRMTRPPSAVSVWPVRGFGFVAGEHRHGCVDEDVALTVPNAAPSCSFERMQHTRKPAAQA